MRLARQGKAGPDRYRPVQLVRLAGADWPCTFISDLQQERGLSEEGAPEGPPERVCAGRQRTHQQLPFPGKQREAKEAAEGLTSQATASRPRRVIVSTV